MADRPQIYSSEFEDWLTDFDDMTVVLTHTREELYDLWEEGYGPWEAESILG